MTRNTNNVEVKGSGIDGAGRGLFACQDFAPGDLVVHLDRPLVAELEIHHMKDTCAWCFQRGATDPMERMQAASMGLPNGLIEIKHCTGCQRVGYCSKACQSKAWKTEHKYECRIIAPKQRPDLPLGVRAVIKLLGRLKASTGVEREQILDILNFQPTVGDGSDLEKIRRQDQPRFDDLQTLAYGAWVYADRPSFDGLGGEDVARRFHFNVMHNAFQIASPLDAAHYGSGFDPLICSANHSCDPNVVRVSNSPNTLLRALKPIKKGEEIFMKYTDTSNPFWIRQAELKENYFFTCQCPKCARCPVSPEDTFAKPPEDLPEEYCVVADKLVKEHRRELGKWLAGTDESRAQLRLAAMQAHAFAVSNDGDATEGELKEALELCIGSGMWTWTRQPVPEICRRLFSRYMASGDIDKTFRLGCKLHLEINPVLYPQPFYPERLIMADVLSTMTVALGGNPTLRHVQEEFAEKDLDFRIIYWGFLLELREYVPKMYGWESPFGKVVKDKISGAVAREVLSEAEIQDEVKGMWRDLKAYIWSLDIIDICNSSSPSESCSVM